MKWIFVSLLFVGFNAHAQLSASPSYVNFGDVSVDSGLGRRTTVFVNSQSNQDNSVYVSNSCFGSFYTYNNCYTLPPYGSCTIQVEYKPIREGYESCSMSIRGSRGGFTTLTISGRGVTSIADEVFGPYSE
ncbi:MAG: hypothetical protein KDD37_08475 [Bdellovibrionales bacterium]|nr:hypothetical protein [Bdellovibrionales bacterium]